ncbi:MAG: ATP-binding cassette domain-containing protein [Bacteroidetes bacterium]|nr:ATP-binding cassette domain-containing protein [Bacteroidota bacterium]
MSILVENVSKLYGQQKALNQVGFEVGKAEIVGFLGPNGAGKSTMMKIITGYIPPNSGKIYVCGYSVLENPFEVKKRVGYLPEKNPLYMDMYVREYLTFVAQIHKVKEVEKRVEEMIQLVGLGSESHKKIHQLSKGYKQRVGLAQSIIHDPEVLILDEPTSGLDPNQIKEIRDVIVSIGKQKTVLLSTHIMQEVEAMCSRVIIVRKGEIVADGAIEEYTRNGKKLEDVFSELTK